MTSRTSKHTPRPGWNDLDAEETGASRLQADQAETIERVIDEKTKDVNERVGMGGSLYPTTTGGARMGPEGYAVYSDGVTKTKIEQDGDFFVGSNTDRADGVSLAVFVNSQAWNSEEMGEGDILIGDNSSSKSNVKWDASEGQFQFRVGLTVTAYMDTDGSLNFEIGNIGGWEITSAAIQKLSSDIGIVLDSTTPKIQVGDTSSVHIILDGANESIRSSNFSAGLSGFNIDSSTGDAEFNNLKARGLIKTAVFEKDTISSIGGSVLILSSIPLGEDMSAADDALLVLEEDFIFTSNDIIRMKDGTDDEWMRVVGVVVDNTVWTVQRDLAGSYASNANPTWRKGQAIVNYGQSGSGGIELLAGTVPQIKVFDHSGSPWATLRTIYTIDESGIAFSNTADVLRFHDSTGVYDGTHGTAIYGEGINDGMDIVNRKHGKPLRMIIKLTNGNTPYLKLFEDPNNANVTLLQVEASNTGAAQFALGGAGQGFSTGILLSANKDGLETVFNDTSYDIDFRIEGATDTSLFKVDAGLDAIGIGGAAESGYKAKVTGSLKVTGTVDSATNLREKLTAARTYYVRTDGNDSNTGLANTAGGAFLNIQRAVDVISTLDINGQTVTIQVADGTYTNVTVLKNVVGFAALGNLVITGNPTTPANVLISVTSNYCFYADGITSVWQISDMKLQTTTSGDCIFAAWGATVRFGNINFGACAGNHLQAVKGTIIGFNHYAVSGGAAGQHMYASRYGVIWISGLTVTFSNTPAFSYFALAQLGGYIDAFSNTFTNGGVVTGTKYGVQQNSIIFVNGASGTYFPGSVGGFANLGGIYG